MQLMVNLIYDPEHKGYVADVPELPGCMSQGRTVEAAVRNVKDAIVAYLEARPRPKRNRPKWAFTTIVDV